jgi:hypothetical protein
MPDNPHPHPQEFGQDVQLFCIALYKIITEGMTSVTSHEVPADPKYNNRYFVIQPRT